MFARALGYSELSTYTDVPLPEYKWICRFVKSRGFDELFGGGVGMFVAVGLLVE